MNKGLRMLYTGDFNTMSQERQPGGSELITLSKQSEAKTHKLKVKDLYGEHEKVLSYEVIDLTEERKKRPWIAERMKQAKEEKEQEEKERKK